MRATAARDEHTPLLPSTPHRPGLFSPHGDVDLTAHKALMEQLKTDREEAKARFEEYAPQFNVVYDDVVEEIGQRAYDNARAAHRDDPDQAQTDAIDRARRVDPIALVRHHTKKGGYSINHINLCIVLSLLSAIASLAFTAYAVTRPNDPKFNGQGGLFGIVLFVMTFCVCVRGSFADRQTENKHTLQRGIVNEYETRKNQFEAAESAFRNCLSNPLGDGATTHEAAAAASAMSAV